MRIAGAGDGALEFLGPNLWRLKTGPSWQLLAFVPIDDTHMQHYVRSDQAAVRWPPAAALFGRLGQLPTRFIINQDTAPVESQPRAEVRLRSGEVLVPSDAPIIADRRWREARRGALRLNGPPGLLTVGD